MRRSSPTTAVVSFFALALACRACPLSKRAKQLQHISSSRTSAAKGKTKFSKLRDAEVSCNIFLR